MRRLLVCFLCACGGASSDPGLEAVVRVTGAQYVPGPLPETSGPLEVVSVVPAHVVVVPGSLGERMTGSLAEGATALLLGRPGDAGHWIVTAGLPDVQVPDLPTFDVRLDFAAELPLGPLALELHAVDAAGRVGPPQLVELEAAPPAPPAGTLVISLAWDVNADLDLHVVEPGGVEIWAGNINSYEPPPPGGPPPPPEAWTSGGILDADSNGACAIDGRRRENVVWTVPPPSGRYLVRVETASLCDQPTARWRVEAWLDGVVLARAEGVGLPSDARGAHGAGAGTRAFEVVLP